MADVTISRDGRVERIAPECAADLTVINEDLSSHQWTTIINRGAGPVSIGGDLPGLSGPLDVLVLHPRKRVLLIRPSGAPLYLLGLLLNRWP